MKLLLWTALACLAGAGALGAESAIGARLTPHIKEIEKLAASPELVEAVMAQNARLPAGFAGMSNAQWKLLPKNHPFVTGLMINAVAETLRKNRSAFISEAFVNDAAGYKVGLLAKTTDWNHKGKPKHDEPMLGKTWIGPVALDESSGAKQIQVAVPIWNDGKPVGSLVVGLNVFQLSADK